MKSISTSSFLILTLTLLSSCMQEISAVSLQVTERLLSFPPGYYNHVVYINGRVVGFADDSRLPNEGRISFAYEGDKQKTLFNPQDDPRCTVYNYFQVVSLLPDGRLGLLKECLDDSASTIFLSRNRSIYAYDWDTGQLEQLVVGKLTQADNPKFYTWNPDMTLGVQETGPGYAGTLYWISPEGILPMDIEIESRGFKWNLKDYLEGVGKIGTARHPSWSPDGETIAFFVSIYGIREQALPKYNINYDLYLMNSETLKPRPELMDVADAGKIVWSPNNEFLLFRGCIGRKLICGLWRYRIIDKTIALIAEGEFADYTWITNERIVAAKNVDLPFKDNQIWEYLISEVLLDDSTHP